MAATIELKRDVPGCCDSRILLFSSLLLSLASLKGPGRCQKHGTTSRPHRPADAMISAAKPGVKWNGVAALKEARFRRAR